MPSDSGKFRAALEAETLRPWPGSGYADPRALRRLPTRDFAAARVFTPYDPDAAALRDGRQRLARLGHRLLPDERDPGRPDKIVHLQHLFRSLRVPQTRGPASRPACCRELVACESVPVLTLAGQDGAEKLLPRCTNFGYT